MAQLAETPHGGKPMHETPGRVLFWGLAAWGLMMAAAGLLMQPPGELLQGWWRILTAPNLLISDSMEIGGMGAALFNAGLMALLSLLLLRALKAEISGPAAAAVMIVCGFSLFGKNPLNAPPLVLGVLLFFRLERAQMGSAGVPALFSTALGPLVSSVALGMGLPLAAGIPLGIALGMLAGFLIIPISRRALGFHGGLNLYNIGFSAGFTGMLLANLLRLLGLTAPTVQLFHPGGGVPMALALGGLMLVLMALGYRINGRTIKGCRALFKESGRLSSDFIKSHGLGLCLINAGLCGLTALLAVLLCGAPLNGPVLGVIITILGFAGFGKHALNILPVTAGSLLATFIGVYSPQATGSMIAVLFSTTLAPVAGTYGPLAGLAAGVLHVSLAHQTGILHAGMNLYNNGFAGGLVAGLLGAVIEALKGIRLRSAQQ